jgi:hypothetical protein
LEATRTGKISLGAIGSGFSDLRLCEAEVDQFAPAAEISAEEILIPATAFGISVGIKDKGRSRALIEAKHTPAMPMRNARTGIANIYMTASDISAFHRRFVTARTLSVETARPISEVCADLKRAGVAVFAPDGQDFSRLFLWDAVEVACSRKSPRRT